MEAANVTTAASQVSEDRHTVTFKFSEPEAKALIRARRDLRKDTLRDNLNDADTDIVNGIVMLAGRVLEDDGRNESSVDFGSRSY